MAQFMGVIKGQKGETSRLGSKSSGLRGWVNGWESGIYIEARHVDGRDLFDVYETSGSNASSPSKLIATIERGKTCSYPAIGQEAVPLPVSK